MAVKTETKRNPRPNSNSEVEGSTPRANETNRARGEGATVKAVPKISGE